MYTTGFSEKAGLERGENAFKVVFSYAQYMMGEFPNIYAMHGYLVVLSQILLWQPYLYNQYRAWLAHNANTGLVTHAQCVFFQNHEA